MVATAAAQIFFRMMMFSSDSERLLWRRSPREVPAIPPVRRTIGWSLNRCVLYPLRSDANPLEEPVEPSTGEHAVVPAPLSL